ncbi:hypothetical protein ID866_10840 [Astraeus odoratus]|nr:hypothetical protein ID866_10840 [Astraeus odoratus]
MPGPVNNNDIGNNNGPAPAPPAPPRNEGEEAPAGDPPLQPPPAGGAPNPQELLASLAAFIQGWQTLHNLDEQREDPERAKKLLAGLDVVPIGLVKRLERVGGTSGGHIDGSSESIDSAPGCAICWDSLLDAETAGFGELEKRENEADNENGNVMAAEATTTSSTEQSPGSTSKSSSSAEPKSETGYVSYVRPFNWPPANATAAEPGTQGTQAEPPVAGTETHPTNPNPDAQPAGNQGQPPANAPAPGAPPQAAGPAGPRPTGPAGPGFNPFPGIPGFHVFPLPGVQIPLGPRPAGPVPPPAGAPPQSNDGTGANPNAEGQRSRAQSLPNMGDNRPPFPNIPGIPVDFVTIGLDMIVHGPPPPGMGPEAGPHPNPHPADNNNLDDADEGEDYVDEGADMEDMGDGDFALPPGDQAQLAALTQEMRQIMDGLLRSTMMGGPGQGPGAAPAANANANANANPDGVPQPQAADDARPQPQAQPQRPRANFFFRSARPGPREHKTWTLPPAPGPSLRQRVEQKEREQGLRCFDMSCGIGPSDDDPYPLFSDGSMEQISIHPHTATDDSSAEGGMSVCAHTFHPACLVSAERVAGWGATTKDDTGESGVVEVSCPVCRAVGCVTRSVWEKGAAAL